jgi:CheY-like chemotaxis protein/predicted regulator of Ras-like GTPase activity (Roadblock/LC7/MglB family)
MTPSGPSAAPTKVLVVDDSVAVRTVVQWALEARHMTVLSAGLVAEAIERFERDEPDLVVCDVHLPDREGFALCEFVKGHPRLSGTPVLLMSGAVDATVVARAAQTRSDELMRKPFLPEDLLRHIDRLLAERAATATAPAPAVGAEGPVPAAATGGNVRTAPVVPPAAPLPPDLRGRLLRLAIQEGVRLALVTDRTGFLIESAGEIGADVEAASALVACLTESADSLTRHLGQGTLRGLTLECEGGLVIITDLDAKAILAIVVREPGDLPKVQQHVRRAIPELAQVL